MSATQIELVELDIDTRICELWSMADDFAVFDLDDVGRFMRAAWARGYHDGLQDAEGRFLKEHGYRDPRGAR